MPSLIVLPFDILLVVAALIAYFNRPRIGGQLAEGMKLLLIGVLVLGCTYLAETLLFALSDLVPVVNRITHRLLVGCAFVFFILGFIKMRRAFEQ
jgi:hypothetical protein